MDGMLSPQLGPESLFFVLVRSLRNPTDRVDCLGCGWVQSDYFLLFPERAEAYFSSKKHRKPLYVPALPLPPPPPPPHEPTVQVKLSVKRRHSGSLSFAATFSAPPHLSSRESLVNLLDSHGQGPSPTPTASSDSHAHGACVRVGLLAGGAGSRCSAGTTLATW